MTMRQMSYGCAALYTCGTCPIPPVTGPGRSQRLRVCRQFVTETALAGQCDSGSLAVELAKILFGFSNNFLARALQDSGQENCNSARWPRSSAMPGIRA
jgi:hypothetical protein